ncbi:MAG: VOC family protein [Chloroflexi bacterium]|nr:VOC family protein [Chloroflexota bacterium]
MLGSSNIMAFVATAQPDAARAFYEGILGLRLIEDAPFALVFDAYGTKLRVQKVQTVAPAPYTTLGWVVDDIVATVRELASRGVQFERYEGLEQDDLGIWSSGAGNIAWFKDPDGNTLSVTQS